MIWFSQSRAKNIPISGSTLLGKAIQLQFPQEIQDDCIYNADETRLLYKAVLYLVVHS